MGFGLLFIGYFVANFMTLNPLGSVFRILGYGIIFVALLKLQKYHRAFQFSVFTTLGMLFVSGAFVYTDIAGIYKDIIGYIEQGFSFVFLSLLLYAILKISRETGVKKLADASIRNFIFISFYYIVCVLEYLPFDVIERVRGELRIISLILYFSCILLNMILFGQCYANICDEKDAEMARKPSRFAWVNHFREEFDRREEKARAETEAYRKEKLNKRKERKKR
ncbi:MAG: hypothetical protein J6Q82_00400 [Clostridia bacterium]|nr:hypothetical protein [Clostridia bacterium]